MALASPVTGLPPDLLRVESICRWKEAVAPDFAAADLTLDQAIVEQEAGVFVPQARLAPAPDTVRLIRQGEYLLALLERPDRLVLVLEHVRHLASHQLDRRARILDAEDHPPGICPQEALD